MKIYRYSLLAATVLFAVSVSASAQLFKKKPTGDETQETQADMITEIQVKNGAEITIQGTRKMDCAVFVIPDPIRIMINVTGVIPAPEIPRTMTINEGLIKTMRVSEFSGGPQLLTRIEALLESDAEYKIDKSGKTITVSLEPKKTESEKTIPVELYSKAQKATTELIETGEVTPEIQYQVVVPKTAPPPGISVSQGSVQAIARPESEAMKPKVEYTATATKVLDIKHRTVENQIQFLIQTDGTVGSFEEFTMRKPNRLVIDLVGIKGRVPRDSYPVNKAGIKRIRLGQHPDRTRVVFDISSKSMPQYYVMRTKGGLMVAVAMSP